MDTSKQQEFFNDILRPTEMHQLATQKHYEKLSSARRTAIFHSVLPVVEQGAANNYIIIPLRNVEGNIEIVKYDTLAERVVANHVLPPEFQG